MRLLMKMALISAAIMAAIFLSTSDRAGGNGPTTTTTNPNPTTTTASSIPEDPRAYYEKIVDENLKVLATIKENQTTLSPEQYEALWISATYRWGGDVEELLRIVDLKIGQPPKPRVLTIEDTGNHWNICVDELQYYPVAKVLAKHGTSALFAIAGLLNNAPPESLSDEKICVLAKVAKTILGNGRVTAYFNYEKKSARACAVDRYNKFLQQLEMIASAEAFSFPAETTRPTTQPTTQPAGSVEPKK